MSGDTSSPGLARTLVLVLAGGGLCALFLGVLSGGEGEVPPPPPENGASQPGTNHPGDPGTRLSGMDGVRVVARSVRELRIQMNDEVGAASMARVYMDRVLPQEVGPRRALLMEALGDDDEDVRWVALTAAFRYGPADARLVKVLLVRALDESELIRNTARAAIQDIRRADGEAVLLLKRALAEAEGTLWGALVHALMNVSPSSDYKARFLKALTDADVVVRRAAAYGLVRVDLSPEQDPFEHTDAIEPLIGALSDEDGDVRMWAAQALSRMEHEAAPAVDALVERLGDPAPHVADWAKAALGEIGAAAIPAAERIFRDADRVRVAGAAYVLRRAGGPEAIRVLRAGLNHADPVIRVRSMMALHDLVPQSDTIVAHYVEAIGTGDRDAVRLALEGLSRLGREAEGARAAVLPLKDHEDDVIRTKARSILAAIGETADGG